MSEANGWIMLALRRNMYSAPSLPWMVSFRGRCFDVMTCSWGAKAAMVTTGSPAMYVPGTASSKPCKAHVLPEAKPWVDTSAADAAADTSELALFSDALREAAMR